MRLCRRSNGQGLLADKCGEKEKLSKVSTLDTGQMTVPLTEQENLEKEPVWEEGVRSSILDIAMNYGDLLP